MRTLKLIALLSVMFLALAQPAQAQSDFVRGDCNADGGGDISDAVFFLGVLFSGGGPAVCEDACDANDDGGADIADAVYILAFLFSGGPAPASPYPACGPDLTADGLSCASFSLCFVPVEICNNGIDDDSDGDVDCADMDCIGDPACPTGPSFATDIQPIFDAACNFCHAGPMPFAGLSLEAPNAYTNIVDVPSAECSPLDFIEPGDPMNSWLFRKVEGTHTAADIVNLGCSGASVGAQMPIGAFCCLSMMELDLIEDWIQQGAAP